MSTGTRHEGGSSDTGIEWDDQYNDPDAKVILVSTDNVGFRVHAWMFARKR
jgi:hypothetical protein